MKRLLTAWLFTLLLCGHVSAQLAGGLMFPGPGTPATSGGGATPAVFDAVSTGFVNNGASASWTHTPVGTPTAVVVCVANLFFSTNITGTITYGGSTMTKLLGQVDSSGNAVEIWGLANPPSGAQTVLITGTAFTEGAAITVTGSSTSTTFRGAGVAATATSSALSVTVPSDPNDLVIDIGVAAAASPGQSATGTNVSKWALSSGGGNMAFGSVATGSASVAMTWSLGSSLAWSQVGASIHAGP